MKIFKFGGASVKDSQAVKNVAEIMKLHHPSNVIVVVSAMGKTTNALEEVVKAYYYRSADAVEKLNTVKQYHEKITNELFPDKNHPVHNEINNLFVEIEWVIEDEPTGTYDFEYDQVVSIGELISSKILSAYLTDCGIKNKWLDARDIIKTDNNYRDAKVDWEKSAENFEHLKNQASVTVTQGFIGATTENFTTTLGREGSDYTAAILAYIANAGSVTIWKDVPGVLNADPKWFDNTVILKNISYLEAIELSYFGATIIHPKTIKPLQNKKIPLFVKSFIEHEKPGTLINENTASDSLIPSFIFKMNQELLSIMPRDFSFIVEENLGDIFNLFAKYKVKINLMQNSAISFSVCVDADKSKIPSLLDELREQYKVLYNENLELVTIRHYDQPTIDRVTLNKEILLEQKSRHTARMVMKDKSFQ